MVDVERVPVPRGPPAVGVAPRAGADRAARPAPDADRVTLQDVVAGVAAPARGVPVGELVAVVARLRQRRRRRGASPTAPAPRRSRSCPRASAEPPARPGRGRAGRSRRRARRGSGGGLCVSWWPVVRAAPEVTSVPRDSAGATPTLRTRPNPRPLRWPMPRAASLRLPVLVFVAGGASLAAEMTGTRLLAPFFGASNLVWANVIGLILIYLSVGYWLGGRLADRHPTERALGLLVLGAAAALAVVPFATRPLFSAAAGGLRGPVGRRVHRLLPRRDADVRAPDHGPRRGVALGRAALRAGRADGRRGLRAPVRPLHDRRHRRAPSCRCCCSSPRSAPGGRCS